MADVDQADFATTFDQLSFMSTSGAEHQSCVEAAARALTGPLASDPAANGGFRRPHSFVWVLCVTDDLEASADPATWREALADAGVSYSVVGPISARCQVDAVDDGGTHRANTGRLKGGVEDICEPWPRSVGLDACGSRTTFFLTGVPQGGVITVTLDGVSLPARVGSRTNWVYDAATNAIRFPDVSVLGRAPRELVVDYQPSCL